MIAERCEHMPSGAPLNSECWTCGHTMAAHTSMMRCDVCAVLLELRRALFESGRP